MAQKTEVQLIDDLDGAEADETIRFGLDGAQYEIDLSERHATELRGVLAPFVTAARRSGGRAQAGRAAKSTGVAGSRSGKSAEIREWARANGFTVNDRGALARSVREAYAAAQAA